MVGKYTNLSDAYLSVTKVSNIWCPNDIDRYQALQHAAIVAERKLVIDWIESVHLEPSVSSSSFGTHSLMLQQYAKTAPEEYDAAWEKLKGADGILVPGGFGDRGIEGKILAANYARVHKKPYLGICLGLQIAV